MIALAAPTPDPVPKRANNKIEVNRMVAMVTPEIGLFDDPTTPAIYAATAEKRKPNTIIITVNSAATGIDLTISA
tara:strand:+ start:1931 stop:2155 length:225 start_codon:yes stop_codon:yes gene_type:complete